MNNHPKLLLRAWLIMALPIVSIAQENQVEDFKPPEKILFVSGNIENLHDFKNNIFLNAGVNVELYLSPGFSFSWQVNVGFSTQDPKYPIYAKMSPGVFFSPYLGLVFASAFPDSTGIISIPTFIGGMALGAIIPETLNFHFKIKGNTTGAIFFTPLIFEFNRNHRQPFNNDTYQLGRVPHGSFEIGFKLHRFRPTSPRRISFYAGLRAPYDKPRWGLMTGVFISF